MKTLTEPKTKKDLVKSEWKRNRGLIDSHEKMEESAILSYKQEFFPRPKETDDKYSCKLFNGKKVVNRVPITTMPSVEPTMTQITWVPIQRNLLPDKDLPTNIPYFGDEVIEKDAKLIASLIEEVNCGSSSEYLDDDHLFQLVDLVGRRNIGDNSCNVVLHHPTSENEAEYVKETLDNELLPRLIVFQAIHSTFPEFGATEELITRYKKIAKKKESEQFAPNIDGTNAADLSAEDTTHTFMSLFCRRCFLYDCPLHRDDLEIDEPLQRPNARELPLPTEACGSQCYLNQPSVVALLSPRTPFTNRWKAKPCDYADLYNSSNIESVKLLLENNTSPQVEPGEWTNAEKSLYRVSIKSFPGNFCAVAKVLATKKCREVFLFSVQEGKTSRGVRNRKVLKAKKFGKTLQAQLYKHTQHGTKENKRPYIPCHHPGKDCSPEVCSCRESNNFCEKFCYCPINCSHRFPGCRCKSNCKTKMCPCFLASRECDPDLCQNCLDGKLDLKPETNSCHNVYLQRLMGKNLYVAPSDIAGLGCFLGEAAEKNDFIAEYVGEMITHEECESRGRIYDMAKSSYMFNLNEEYIVDAARLGGNIRFANHSAKPNCQVKILLVNGDYRIGIYAKQHIQMGEELFFDYGKDFVGHDLIEQ